MDEEKKKLLSVAIASGAIGWSVGCVVAGSMFYRGMRKQTTRITLMREMIVWVWEESNTLTTAELRNGLYDQIIFYNLANDVLKEDG